MSVYDLLGFVREEGAGDDGNRGGGTGGDTDGQSVSIHPTPCTPGDSCAPLIQQRPLGGGGGEGGAASGRGGGLGGLVEGQL